jgi:hypothetical protein
MPRGKPKKGIWIMILDVFTNQEIQTAFYGAGI